MQEQKMPVVAVVLAAGFGTRFDENNPKQLVSVGGKPIVCWSIEAFENNDRISDIIVVVNERVEETVNELIDEAGYAKVRAIVPGGAERVDSSARRLGPAQAGRHSLRREDPHPRRRASVRRGAVHRRLHRQPGPVQCRHRGLRLHRHDSAHRGSGRPQGGQIRAGTSEHLPRADPAGVPFRYHRQSLRTGRRRPPTSIRPTTRAWWWTTCPTSRSPS